MKTIKDRFMKAPYGFVEDDIHWLVARLFKRGDLSFTVNGESVNLNNRSEEEIIGYITKKQFVDKLLTEVRVRVPENQKKAVRTVMKELFKVAPPADDEDTIMKNFQHYCENRITEIERLEPRIMPIQEKNFWKRARSGFPHWCRFKHRWNSLRPYLTSRTI